MPQTTLAPASPGVAFDERRSETRGMLLGLAGVALFSLTLPFTRMAVAELDPLFVPWRAPSAPPCWPAPGCAGKGCRRRRAPPSLPLSLVALGCILGFPLLTSIAMRSLPASHGAVLVGALPLCTALYSALRGHERPSRGFWAVALLGSGLVVAFALPRAAAVSRRPIS
jgi:drug/metabolite transporter (DMT)-like permease